MLKLQKISYHTLKTVYKFNKMQDIKIKLAKNY